MKIKTKQHKYTRRKLFLQFAINKINSSKFIEKDLCVCEMCMCVFGVSTSLRLAHMKIVKLCETHFGQMNKCYDCSNKSRCIQMESQTHSETVVYLQPESNGIKLPFKIEIACDRE